MSTVGVQHHTMFIDGEQVDADEQYEIISPSTEEVVCTVALDALLSTPPEH